jgi:hypothetical protein
MKPTICIDFDGVIHSYEKGWQEGVIYGTVTEGFFSWASVMKDHFTLVVYSSRSKQPAMLADMKTWLSHQWYKWYHFGPEPLNAVLMDHFEFASQKPSAFITIDDRCICFDGDWSKITPSAIYDFKPWNKR